LEEFVEYRTGSYHHGKAIPSSEVSLPRSPVSLPAPQFSLTKQDYVSTHFKFLMETCTVELLSAFKETDNSHGSESFVLVLLSDLLIDYENRPNSDGYSLHTKLKKFPPLLALIIYLFIY